MKVSTDSSCRLRQLRIHAARRLPAPSMTAAQLYLHKKDRSQETDVEKENIAPKAACYRTAEPEQIITRPTPKRAGKSIATPYLAINWQGRAKRVAK